ncbi:MAG: hypothetical protein EOM21_20910 [Gammaproteobacteria bacterium]|nr:hypothetical protein [Gammaproteobacteria bacterium]
MNPIEKLIKDMEKEQEEIDKKIEDIHSINKHQSILNRRKRDREYYYRNRERIIKRNRNYYLNNEEAMKKYKKEWRAKKLLTIQ